MIKKMLVSLCAVALAVCSVVGVSAYQIDNYNMDGYYSSITYDNPSNYAVVIPEIIDGNQSAFSLSATHMNLHENETVEVYSADGNIIDLTSTETDDIAKFHINIDDAPVAVFENGELTSPVVYSWVSNSNEIAATHYSGTISFRVRLVEN